MPARLELLGDDCVAPCASSQRASASVVIDARIFAPRARTCASSSGAGRPKCKLATGYAKALNTSAAAALKGARRPGRDGLLSNPKLLVVRRQQRAQAASRSASGGGV